MRTIHRIIVGGFLFSMDNKLLLGKNRKGGVYEGTYVVPGGGVDEGETKESALRREMLEETGIDIQNAPVALLNESTGEQEKTLPENDERVLVHMELNAYRIDLGRNADSIEVKTESDWHEPRWFEVHELQEANLSEPTRQNLIIAGIIAN